MSNLPQFISGLRAFEVKVEESSKDHIRGVAKRVLTSIINGTPVDTGKAVANWSVSPNTPSGYVTDDVDPGKHSTISKGVSVIDSIDPHINHIIIENNLKYISSLEDGHSSQAPAGMVAVALVNERVK